MDNMIFRVDKRSYEIGEIILPQTIFEEQLKDEKLKMEEMLNKKRIPGIPERSKCLFLFQDLQGALRFYSKYGGNVYGVKALSPIYYRGDMNKLDNILDLFKFIDGDDKDGIIDAAVNSFCPCYEILVGSAKVVEKFCDNSRFLQFKEELNSCGSIERTLLYKELIGIAWQRQESLASASHGSGQLG